MVCTYNDELRRVSEVCFSAATGEVESRLQRFMDTGAKLSIGTFLHQSERQALLVDVLDTFQKLRKVPVQVVAGLCRREAEMLSALAIESAEPCITQQEIAKQTVRLSSLEKEPLHTQFSAYCSVLTSLESHMQSLFSATKETVTALRGEVHRYQGELIAKRGRELDYAEVVRIATDEAVSNCKALLVKLGFLESRCNVVEIRLSDAEKDLARCRQVSRKPTEQRRQTPSFLWSPRTPATGRHRHTLSIGNETPMGNGLSSAVECLDAMNERVEQLAGLFEDGKKRERVDSLQTCVVSHRFRTLLQGFERWRQSR